MLSGTVLTVSAIQARVSHSGPVPGCLTSCWANAHNVTDSFRIHGAVPYMPPTDDRASALLGLRAHLQWQFNTLNCCAGDPAVVPSDTPVRSVAGGPPGAASPPREPAPPSRPHLRVTAAGNKTLPAAADVYSLRPGGGIDVLRSISRLPGPSFLQDDATQATTSTAHVPGSCDDAGAEAIDVAAPFSKPPESAEEAGVFCRGEPHQYRSADRAVLCTETEAGCAPGDTLEELPALVLWLTERAAEAAEARRAADSRAITLTTLHRSKGREWDHVFLVDACEGQLPLQPPPRRGSGGSNRRAAACGAADEAAAGYSQGVGDVEGGGGDGGDSQEIPEELAEVVEVAEERRLLYVGMTRAKRTLCVSWAAADARGRACAASPFLAELPEANCRRGVVEDAVARCGAAAACGGGGTEELWVDGVRVAGTCFHAVLEAALALEVRVRLTKPGAATSRIHIWLCQLRLRLCLRGNVSVPGPIFKSRLRAWTAPRMLPPS